jgi:anti-sigma factor ChrR (cupin superfamily)
MSEQDFKALAYQIAEEMPRHLDQPTSPPIRWKIEGGMIRVLLADGRTVRVALPRKTAAKQVAATPPPAPVALESTSVHATHGAFQSQAVKEVQTRKRKSRT